MAKAFIAELLDGSRHLVLSAKQVQVRQRRSGEPYLSLVLADGRRVPAVMWEGVDEPVGVCRTGIS